MLKNEQYQVRIDDMGSKGEGIGHIDGFAVFVENALPGELVLIKMLKVNKNYGFGKLIEILEPSPYRIEPLCPAYAQCGGCTLQHLSYDEQLRYKKKKVADCLERIGHINTEIMDVIGMETPYHYRNKAQLPVGGTLAEIKIGFYAERSHRIIPIDDCNISQPVVSEINTAIIQYMKRYGIAPYDHESTNIKHVPVNSCRIRHILVRSGFTTKEIMVCLVICGNELPHTDKLIQSLSAISGVTSIALNINKEDTNVILGRETRVIWGKGAITDYIGMLKFDISPVSFFQVNPVQAKVLYEKALEFAVPDKNNVVIDAYCGIGSISLFFARHVKNVYGIEIIEDAVRDARRNAEINGINNAEFFTGESGEVIDRLYNDKKVDADIVIVNPPRKGCETKLLNCIIEKQPEKVVYISCDPGTLARDLRILADGGYYVEKAQPVDMFPMTCHIETVVLMTKMY